MTTTAVPCMGVTSSVIATPGLGRHPNRSRGPAGPGSRGRARGGSARPTAAESGRGRGADVDHHVGAVDQHVVHGRPLTGLLDQRGEFLGGGVALDLEADPNLPVAVADGVGQPENAQQVDVALDGRGHPVQGDAAGGRDVAQPRRQARGDGVQQEFHRGRAVVVADQDGRVIGVKAEGFGSTGVFLTRTEETLDAGTVVGSVDPLVAGPELELRDLRLPLHGIEDGEQAWDIDTVAGGPGLRTGHGEFSFWGWLSMTTLRDVRHPGFPRPSAPTAGPAIPGEGTKKVADLSLIHISEPTRRTPI